MANDALFEKLLTGNESSNQIVVGGDQEVAMVPVIPFFPHMPLVNLANLTRWVSLRAFILHEFPTKPLRLFYKTRRWRFINAGPPEALSLQVFSRQHRRRQWHPTPVLLPGKSHGRRSLVRLHSTGSLGVGHDWATSLSLFTFMQWRRKWQPTPVFLPGESQGRGSLVGCRLWGCTESDTTEAT